MKNSEKGFTLIELLVVIAIIGILAAIAIPQYATYKRAAVDSQMKSDLHNAAAAMEVYYGSNSNTYTGATVTALRTYGYRQSGSVNMSVTSVTPTSFVITATSLGGNHTGFNFNSESGIIAGF